MYTKMCGIQRKILEKNSDVKGTGNQNDTHAVAVMKEEKLLATYQELSCPFVVFS